VVHAVDEHRRVVLGGSRQDDLLGAGGQVLGGAFLVQEEAGGFDDDVGADFVPLEVGRDRVSAVRRMVLPLTTAGVALTFTSPLNWPCTESYLSM
jgi:hypothetical protein